MSAELNFTEYLERLDNYRETHEHNIELRAENTAIRSFLFELSDRAEIALSELTKDPYNKENIEHMLAFLSMAKEGIAKKNGITKESQICYPHLQSRETNDSRQAKACYSC